MKHYKRIELNIQVDTQKLESTSIYYSSLIKFYYDFQGGLFSL